MFITMHSRDHDISYRVHCNICKYAEQCVN